MAGLDRVGAEGIDITDALERCTAAVVAVSHPLEGVSRFDLVQDIEEDVRRVSRQSVCAVRDLSAGEVIARADVTVKRPGTGLPAAMLEDVIGQELKRDVKANHLLHEGDV